MANTKITNHIVDKTFITGQTAVTAADGDYLLVSDASDSGALKKVLASDLIQTSEEVQDLIGAMFSSNTETGIAATYQDADGTIDLVVGTLNQDTTGTAATVTGAAQSAITSLGTLTALTVDDITIDGSTISDAGNFTLDVEGDINFDANGSDITLLDGGTEFGRFKQVSNGMRIQTTASDADMTFMGNDGGSEFTALTLDMSAAGGATFNEGIKLSGLNGGSGLAFDMAGSGDYTIKESSTDDVMSFQGHLFHNFSNGRIGIGTAAPQGLLHIDEGSADDCQLIVETHAAGDSMILWTQGNSGPAWAMGLDAGSGTADGLSIAYKGDGFPSLTSQSLVAITTGGRVGIGTTTPSEPLTVRSSGENVNATMIEIGNDVHATNTKDAWMKFVAGVPNTDGSWAIGAYPGSFRFAYLGDRTTAVTTASAEKMRISSSGGLGIGTTSTSTRSLSVSQLASNAEAVLITSSNSDVTNNSAFIQLQFQGDATPAAGSKFINFANQSALMGTIKAAGASSVQYNTSSDERLKDNIVDADGQLETVLKTKVREFDWKNDGVHNLGFIAQELNEVIPDIVYEGGDDENKDPWQIDYGKITPYLVKAIQEQQEQIEQLKTEIQTLKEE